MEPGCQPGGWTWEPSLAGSVTCRLAVIIFTPSTHSLSQSNALTDKTLVKGSDPDPSRAGLIQHMLPGIPDAIPFKGLRYNIPARSLSLLVSFAHNVIFQRLSKMIPLTLILASVFLSPLLASPGLPLLCLWQTVVGYNPGLFLRWK